MVKKLKINIDQITDSEQKEITFDFNEVIIELQNQEPVIGSINVQVYGNRIKIIGQVRTIIKSECDRCLNCYDYEVNCHIDEDFLRGKLEMGDKKEFELVGDNFVEELLDNNEIDITNLVYQEILLNIPSQSLCYEECKGSEALQELYTKKNNDPRLDVFNNFFNDNDNK